MIDWERVVEVMYPGDDQPTHEIGPVVDAVVAAWDKFGETDFAKGECRGLEERIELDIPAFGARKQVMVVDQWWKALEKPNWWLIVDWKLRTKDMNDRWRKRLEDSQQGRWYAHGLVAGQRIPLTDDTKIMVQFRGIKDDGSKTSVVSQTLTAPDLWDFDGQRQYWEKRFRLDHEDGYQRPWGRDRSGCFMYGPMYPCQFYDCEEIKPDVPADFPIVSNSSFSITEDYHRCPERARLLTIHKNLGILEEHVEEGESARMGKAFHAGIADCYEQYKEKRDAVC